MQHQSCSSLVLKRLNETAKFKEKDRFLHYSDQTVVLSNNS